MNAWKYTFTPYAFMACTGITLSLTSYEQLLSLNVSLQGSGSFDCSSNKQISVSSSAPFLHCSTHCDPSTRLTVRRHIQLRSRLQQRRWKNLRTRPALLLSLDFRPCCTPTSVQLPCCLIQHRCAAGTECCAHVSGQTRGDCDGNWLAWWHRSVAWQICTDVSS